MKSAAVLILGAIVVSALDMLLGVKIEPAWKKVLHAVIYMAWGSLAWWAATED